MTQLVDLTLNHEKAELLREVLDRTIRDLRYEISNTDRADFKRTLRSREVLLREMIEPLGGMLPDSPLKP